MAILPTKPLKRGSIYLLGIATCVLLFQIYRDRAGNKQNQPPGGYSFASQPHEFTSHVQTSRDNGGKVSKNPRGLVVGSGDSDKEIKALRMRLKDREDLVRRLREELESVKADREKLRRGIENLKETTATLPSTLAQQPRAVTEKPPLQGNEMEMSKKIPFLTITKTHVYETELHPKPKEYIFHGQRKGSRAVKQGQRHILAAQAAALDVLNLNSSFKLSLDHVVEGVFRVDHNTGMEYELSFRYPRTDRYAVVHLRRALGPLELASPAANNITASELINLILPLSGRLERFQKFLDMFIDVCVQKDKNVFLTVVLYGAKDFKTVRDILENLEKTYNFRKYQLIVRDKPFSRGRTLHDGVMYWTASENVLMFFCDVDVTFSTEFLRRCRTYTKPGKSVYYPIVFSLYNPKNVYEDGNIPSFEEQLKIGNHYKFQLIWCDEETTVPLDGSTFFVAQCNISKEANHYKHCYVLLVI